MGPERRREPGSGARSGSVVRGEVSVQRRWRRGWVHSEGERLRHMSPTPQWGLSAGSLREPPRRISCAGRGDAAPRRATVHGSPSGDNGAKDAPWGGRTAPARSAPLRHHHPPIPQVHPRTSTRANIVPLRRCAKNAEDPPAPGEPGGRRIGSLRAHGLNFVLRYLCALLRPAASPSQGG